MQPVSAISFSFRQELQFSELPGRACDIFGIAVSCCRMRLAAAILSLVAGSQSDADADAEYLVPQALSSKLSSGKLSSGKLSSGKLSCKLGSAKHSRAEYNACQQPVVWATASGKCDRSRRSVPVDKVLGSKLDSCGRPMYLVQWVAPNPRAPDEPWQTWEYNNPLAAEEGVTAG